MLKAWKVVKECWGNNSTKYFSTTRPTTVKFQNNHLQTFEWLNLPIAVNEWLGTNYWDPFVPPNSRDQRLWYLPEVKTRSLTIDRFAKSQKIFWENSTKQDWLRYLVKERKEKTVRLWKYSPSGFFHRIKNVWPSNTELIKKLSTGTFLKTNIGNIVV